MREPGATDTPRLAPAGTAALGRLESARRAGGEIVCPGLRVRLAREFGFCQGVERAVARALCAAKDANGSPAETRGSAGGTPRLFVCGEIIHNPSINEQLRGAGITQLPPPGTPQRFSGLRPTDRVIVPAFGISITEEAQLRDIGCTVIDTTCGWVRRVWEAARRFSAAGLTIVIHGKREHEETRATASRISGPWVIVRNRDEAQHLAAQVRSVGRDRSGACVAGSPHFDARRDLERLGLVNQTTMLSSETEQIAEILRDALHARLGVAPGPAHFRTLDTFCPATQRRQDAVRELLAAGDLALLLVVGGFRSSNTAHLARLGAEQVPSFHIEDAAGLISASRIRHLPPESTAAVITSDWLPPQPRTIGITAGASTPELEIGRVLERLLELHAAEVAALAARRDPAGGMPR